MNNDTLQKALVQLDTFAYTIPVQKAKVSLSSPLSPECDCFGIVIGRSGEKHYAIVEVDIERYIS